MFGKADSIELNGLKPAQAYPDLSDDDAKIKRRMYTAFRVIDFDS
jgi:hypothetical protein